MPTKDLGQIKGESCSRNNTLKIGVKLGHLVRPEQLGWGAAPSLGGVRSECGYNMRCILKSGEMFPPHYILPLPNSLFPVC